MKLPLEWWDSRCKGSAILRFVDINLRGIGQVMFQDNPLSGLLFFIAIGWGSFVAGMPEVAIGGVVALLAGTLTAQWLRVDAAGLAAGLYGYNAYLVGLALGTFLAVSPLFWIYVALGGAVSVVATLGMANVFKTWGVAALTAPFVLTTWLLLLATYAFTAIEGSGLPMSAEVTPLDPSATNPLAFGDFLQGILKSISQVFLKASILAALLLLAGLAVNSLAAAAFAVGGAIVAVIAGHILGAESDLVTGGLMGFSPVLTAIAIGAVFYQPSPRVALYAFVGTVFTVIAQGAMNVVLMPFGIPTLTAPFVLVSWLFLLPRQHFGQGAHS
jgi:urea transporter